MPCRKKIGTKTMQMLKVATNAGTAICCAPSRIVSRRLTPSGSKRLMFSISTVASSTRMPTANAMPPRVIKLMVSPNALRTTREHKIDNGIEVTTIKVLRQLPKNSNIINEVRPAASNPSLTTPSTAARTNSDWSMVFSITKPSGVLASICGKAFNTRSTISSVEAPPLFMMVSSAPRRPSLRTMLVWNEEPSWT